jgi:glycosyltransferase involved in cell wall biosynthesis
MQYRDRPGFSGRPTVLVLATTYPRWANDHEPGFVHELCRRLTDRFDVVVVVPDAPGADASGQLDGVDVIRYRYAPRRFQTLVNDGGIAGNLRRERWKWLLVPGFLLMQYVAARREMGRRHIDVIHAHWLISPGVIARFLSGRGVPYVVTSHGGDLFGFRSSPFVRIKRWVAASAASMSVVSSAMAEEARTLSLPVDRIDVIPMGVDVEHRFVAEASTLRASNELLFVGRLVEKKGLRYLLDAMPSIIEARRDVRLRIVGFGPERPALEARVTELGLDGHVTFVGAVEQRALPDIYRRATIFVAPFVRDASGDQEGLPVALMEAVLTGCPFVVGDVNGLDDLLGSEASAFRVDPTQPHAIARAVLDSLDHPQKALDVAAKARDIARAHVDWRVVSKRYGQLIADAIEGRVS